MGGDKDDRRRDVFLRQFTRNGEPVKFRHGHVEQYQIGRKCLDQPQRRSAIARGSGYRDHVQPRAYDLYPLDCERFVINDQSSERGFRVIAVSHFESTVCGFRCDIHPEQARIRA